MYALHLTSISTKSSCIGKENVILAMKLLNLLVTTSLDGPALGQTFVIRCFLPASATFQCHSLGVFASHLVHQVSWETLGSCLVSGHLFSGLAFEKGFLRFPPSLPTYSAKSPRGRRTFPSNQPTDRSWSFIAGGCSCKIMTKIP